MLHRIVVFCGLASALLCGCGSDDGSGVGASAAAGSGTSAEAAGIGATAAGRPAAGSSAGSSATSQPSAAGSAPQVTPPPPPRGRTMPPAGGSAAGSTPPPQAGQPAAGTGGMPPAPSGNPGQILNPPPKPSAGCGMPAPMAGMASIDVMGTQRDYIMSLPQGYDPSKPYKLIFAWHGLGGTAQSIAASWYGLGRMSQNSAIFISGQGLETSSGGAGWQNSNGQDVAFVKALYARLQGSVCFDENRVFSVGMSYGGIMSNTLGCAMGDIFRAIAPMAGSGPRQFGGSACVGQVAAWITHGNTDDVVSFASGQASRDHWAMSNHCGMQTAPVAPDGCVAYEGCDAGHPVHWCEFAGGHTIPPFATEAIFNFFLQF